VAEVGGFNYESTLAEIPLYIQQGIAKGKSGDKWHPVIDKIETKLHPIEITQKSIFINAKGKGGAKIVIDKLK
jgi:hypothetical protein